MSGGMPVDCPNQPMWHEFRQMPAPTPCGNARCARHHAWPHHPECQRTHPSCRPSSTCMWVGGADRRHRRSHACTGQPVCARCRVPPPPTHMRLGGGQHACTRTLVWHAHACHAFAPPPRMGGGMCAHVPHAGWAFPIILHTPVEGVLIAPTPLPMHSTQGLHHPMRISHAPSHHMHAHGVWGFHVTWGFTNIKMVKIGHFGAFWGILGAGGAIPTTCTP